VVSAAEGHPEGHRAKKRRATENAIELAAVSLSLRSGDKPVTIDAICEIAEVSRATFFNYFPNKDSAIYGKSLEFEAGPTSDAILATSVGNLPQGIFNLMVDSIGHSQVHVDVARGRRELLVSQPSAATHAVRAIVSLREQLVDICESWLSRNPAERKLPTSPRREAQLSVSIAEAAAIALLDEWRNGSGDALVTEHEFQTSVDDLATILEGTRSR
jgi:AcrR family transcriptional regulator